MNFVRGDLIRFNSLGRELSGLVVDSSHTKIFYYVNVSSLDDSNGIHMVYCADIVSDVEESSISKRSF